MHRLDNPNVVASFVLYLPILKFEPLASESGFSDQAAIDNKYSDAWISSRLDGKFR
jgi:hypothetical protein